MSQIFILGDRRSPEQKTHKPKSNKNKTLAEEPAFTLAQAAMFAYYLCKYWMLDTFPESFSRACSRCFCRKWRQNTVRFTDSRQSKEEHIGNNFPGLPKCWVITGFQAKGWVFLHCYWPFPVLKRIKSKVIDFSAAFNEINSSHFDC